MNLNELAKEISRLEGGKKELSIAQIKEVIKCMGVVLCRFYQADNHKEFVSVVAKIVRIGRPTKNGEKHVKKAKKKK